MPPSWPPRTDLRSCLKHAAGRFALQRAGLHEIKTLSALRESLQAPATILCLGNGPSSEDDRIPAAFDCLFRVNWTWLARGYQTDPDIVFTADTDVPPAGSRAILGFPTTEDAIEALNEHRPAGAAPAVWFTVPKLIAPGPRSAYPTNGALMIAVAVALEPARLIVAGIDLYRHPEGKYPGATDEPNEYAEIHDPAVDLAVIGDAFAAYRGELTILSDNLSDALAR